MSVHMYNTAEHSWPSVPVAFKTALSPSAAAGTCKHTVWLFVRGGWSLTRMLQLTLDAEQQSTHRSGCQLLAWQKTTQCALNNAN